MWLLTISQLCSPSLRLCTFLLQNVVRDLPKAGQVLNVNRYLCVGTITGLQRAFLSASVSSNKDATVPSATSEDKARCSASQPTGGIGLRRAFFPQTFPWWHHLLLSSLFFLMTWANNAAYAFGRSRLTSCNVVAARSARS